MPDLLAHVAADHLGAPGFAAPPASTSTMAPTPMASHAPSQPQLSLQQPAQPMSQFDLSVSQPALQAQSSQAVIATDLASFNLDALDQTQLLSCLWDDCFPLPTECAADPNETCPHPTEAHQHIPAPTSHTHAASEPFSPQTMLRHVLQEHLGVPGDILGWPADLDTIPIPPLTQTAVNKAHEMMHSPHHHHFQPLPTPPSSSAVPTPSPPPSKPLICQWQGCAHSHAFSDPATLMDHLAHAHVGRGKDSYVCLWGECGADGHGRVFRSRQKVLRHLQSHTGHRPYVCEICDQAFSEAAPLAAHLRRHAHEKPFVCDHPGCGKRFAISSSLTIHMRTHNGEKPFICPHCNKGFVEASNLTKHIRTHTGERPFACPYPGCGKRFPRPDQLKRHMGVHDKDKGKVKC